MKRILFGLLSAALLLGLLAGCGGEGETPSNTASASVSPSAALAEYTAAQLAELILPHAACEDPEALEELNPNADGERLGTYLELAYGLTDQPWEDCAVFRATGASAFELAVLRFADESAAAGAVELFEKYQTGREADFTGYAPAQADMVHNGQVKQTGAWVGLFLCPDSGGAASAFAAALEGGELPDAPETPEPLPTPSPAPADPAEKLPLQSIVESIYFSLVENVGGMGEMHSLRGSPEYFSSRYGLTEEDFASTAILVSGYKELLILRCADEDAADRAEEQLRSYTGRIQEIQAEEPDGEDWEPVGVYRQGPYVGLFACPDPDQARDAFFSVLETGELLTHTASVSESPAFDLKDLLLRLLVEGGACPDWRGTKSKSWTDSSFSFALMRIASVYGAVPRQYEKCVYAYWDSESIDDYVSQDESPYHLALFQTAGEEEAKALLLSLERGLEAKRREIRDDLAYLTSEDFDRESYDPFGEIDMEQHLSLQTRRLKLLETAQVTRAGRYAAVLVCDDPTQAAIFLPRYAASADTAGYFTRFYEGGQTVVYDYDPDYPDRELFTPPNEEDMSIYDTSAILSAWEKGDPSGLSDYDRKIYDAAQAVLDEVITGGMTDYEKERAVYTWITNTVDYGWSRMDVLAETSRDAYGPYGGLVNHEAVCLGYATTFQLLMDLLDIECLTVVGAAIHSTGDHAWNVVKINGNWYCTDVAWGRDQIGGEYEWRYFNITSDEMAQDHQWDYSAVPEAVTEGKGK